MQVIYQNKDERSYNKRIDSVDVVICAGKISRYMEGKHTEGLGRGFIRI